MRRLNRTVRLPSAHSKADFLKIARAIHPNGDEPSWTLLAGCAIALPKKQASAIAEAFISATDIAEEDGRESVTYEDIEAALALDFPAVEERASTPSAPAVQPQCTRSARTISAVLARASTTGSRSRQPGVLTG